MKGLQGFQLVLSHNNGLLLKNKGFDLEQYYLPMLQSKYSRRPYSKMPQSVLSDLCGPRNLLQWDNPHHDYNYQTS